MTIAESAIAEWAIAEAPPAGGGTGTLNATLGALTLSSAGTLPIVGTLSATLGAATLSATGGFGLAGTVNATLGSLTADATGTLAISGSVTATLGALALSASGAAPRTATLSVTLGALTLTATNIVTRRPLPTWYYVPGPMPINAEAWIKREFERVSQATFAAAPFLQLQVNYSEPVRPREGMVVYADGSSWDPGSGAGVYVRGASGWTKL